MKVGRLYSAWRHLPANLFEPGVNRVHVVLNANDHSVWGLGGEPIGDDVLVDTDTTGDPVVVGEIRYRLTWNWEEVERVQRGWRVVNNLGYEVTVTGGRLVTRSLELVPCHYQPADNPVADLWDWLTPRTAYAGHGSLVPNPAKITRSLEEDLFDPSEAEVEIRSVTDPEYCQAHYLIARPTGAGPQASALELQGTYRKRELRGELGVSSNLAYGELKDLQAAIGIVGGIDVAVERQLGTIFDGVDFGAMDDRTIGLTILRTLVRETRVTAASR